MIITRLILTVVSALSLFACSSYTEEGEYLTSDGKVEVVMPVEQASTRTEIADDLSTTSWCVGDEIALWATGEDDGASYLVGEKFTMRYYGLQSYQAEFSSSISPMDESQNYTYKGFYPYPSSISGTTVGYTIPSSQSGEFDGLYDYRVADGVVGQALSGSTMGGSNLLFRSLVHAIRITIPAGENELGEDVGIKTLAITLPFDAVGTMSLDMSDTSADPTITSAGRSIALDLSADPLMAGDGRYVWIFTNPASNVTGDILIAAVGENDAVTDNYAISVSNHTFTAGHITPINTHIEPEIPYTINFVEGTNNLGETAIKMSIATTDGSEITGGASSLVLTSSNGVFSFDYTPRTNPDLVNKSFTVTYESNSAIVTGDNFSIGTLAAGNAMDVKYNLPYLLDEDFSSISSSDSSEDASSISGLTGWTAGPRCEWWSGKRVAMRSYSNAGGPYDSRLNSLTFSAMGLKSTASVTVVVTFGSDWCKNKSSSMSIEVGRGTDTGWKDSIYGTNTISLSNNSSASSTSTLASRTATISGCTSTYHIVWQTAGENGTWFNYDPVYIDDVKVKIQ